MINDRWTVPIAKFTSAMLKRGQSGDVYRDRGGSKVGDDVALGKRGECLAHEALGSSPPDFTVLPSGDKNWSADLMLGDTPIHVKTCSARTKYITKCRSWTFELSDRIFMDGGWVVLVYCESWRSTGGWVSRVYDFKSEIEPLLTDPVFEKYHGIKKCLMQKALKG